MREMKSITASINNDCITIRLAHSDSLVLIMQQNKNDRLYKCVLYSKKESYIISYVLVKEM